MKPTDNKADRFIYLSKETNKYSYLELKPISNFLASKTGEKEEENTPHETLFERKELSLKILKNENKSELKNINIDNSLPEYQKIILSDIIKKINQKEIEFFEAEEIIQKAGVVLSEKEYNDEINKLNDKEILNKIKYKNYKLNLIDCLNYLLTYNDNDDEFGTYLETARKKLNLDKDFKFNNFIDISEENIFYYTFCLKLYYSLYNILDKFSLYYELLKLLKNFFETKNLNNLKKHNIDNEDDDDDEMLYLEILDYYLTDKNAISNEEQRDYIIESLTKKTISKELLISKIEELNSYSEKNGNLFKLNIDGENLKFTFNKIQRNPLNKRYMTSFTSKFKINSLTKDFFAQISPKDLKNNADDKLYQSVIYSKIKDCNPVRGLMPYLKKAVLKIASSKAMEKYFEDVYQKKYKNLEYHFGKKDVIDIFFKNIRIIPIINKDDNAFCDSTVFKIYLPSNPGEISKLNYLGELRALIFGKYLVLIFHELMGHLLRRYYNFLTNGEIPFNSEDDRKIINKENGYYFEKHFLGISHTHNISITDIFHILRAKGDYPLIDDHKELSLDDVKIVINEYKDLFDFISFNENEINKVYIYDYYIYLVHCERSLIKSNIYSYQSFIELYL